MEYSAWNITVNTTLNITLSISLFVQIQALNKTVTLMGRAMKSITKRLLGYETLSSTKYLKKKWYPSTLPSLPTPTTQKKTKQIKILSVYNKKKL